METVVLALIFGGPVVIALATGPRPTLANGLLGQALLVLLAAAVGWLVLDRLSIPGPALGFAPPNWSTLLWAAGIALVFIFALGRFLMRLPDWLGLKGFQGGLGTLSALPLWYLALAVLIGGVVEEFLYRGAALAVLERAGMDPILAALLASVAFGLAHLPLWGPGPSLSITLSGSIFSALYLFHGDLVANMIAHVAVDAVGILGARVAAARKRSATGPENGDHQ
jgi:membrane protease YdiL (CAAX protease family)